ncbi:hypothetical protein TNCV_351131 [Trichonephila clavipes]|nr:hypothetical protein TNCV_351131 [Trichonephila clavipes]
MVIGSGPNAVVSNLSANHADELKFFRPLVIVVKNFEVRTRGLLGPYQSYRLPTSQKLTVQSATKNCTEYHVWHAFHLMPTPGLDFLEKERRSI